MKREWGIFFTCGIIGLIVWFLPEQTWYSFDEEAFLKHYRQTAFLFENNRCFVSPEVMYPMRGSRWFQWFWEPCVDCSKRRRFGKPGDGGKWVCLDKPFKEDSFMISVGSNNEFSYEMALINKFDLNEIEVYDHTSFPPTESAGKKYDRIKFYGEKMTNEKLENIISRDNFKKKIAILKVDCEGCELELFTPKILEQLHVMGTQLLIEVHWMTLKQNGIVTLWERMANAGYGPFSKEPNIENSDGSCVEYSFLPINNQ